MLNPTLSSSANTLPKLYLSRGVVIPSKSLRNCQQMVEAHAQNVRFNWVGVESFRPKQYVLERAWAEIPEGVRGHFYGYRVMAWYDVIALQDLWRQETFRVRCDALT